jgi:hypothetical protein
VSFSRDYFAFSWCRAFSLESAATNKGMLSARRESAMNLLKCLFVHFIYGAAFSEEQK